MRRPVGSKIGLQPAVQLGHRRIEGDGRRRVVEVHDPHADLGHEPAGEVAQLARRQRRPAAGGQRRRAVDLGQAGQRRLGGDVVGMALERHPGRGAVPQDRRPAGRGRRRRANGSASPANQRDTAGRGRVRRITSPMKASVPWEPTSNRHRSKPLTFFTVGPPALATAPSAVTTRAWSRASRTGP